MTSTKTSLDQLVNAVRAEVTRIQSELAAAKEAAEKRLNAALKDLGAPQSPAGRKRIGEAGRKRKPAAPGPAPTPAVCCECRSAATRFSCPEPGCDANLCDGCINPHAKRWHSEVA